MPVVGDDDKKKKMATMMMMMMMVRCFRCLSPALQSRVTMEARHASGIFRVTAYPTEVRQARAILWNRGSQPGQNILNRDAE